MNAPILSPCRFEVHPNTSCGIINAAAEFNGLVRIEVQIGRVTVETACESERGAALQNHVQVLDSF